MKNFIISFFVVLTFVGEAQNFIVADFKTSEGDFSVELDYLNAPLAVANFIHLAGKGEDIFETPNGVPVLTSTAHYAQSFYSTTSESDTQRQRLNVKLVPQTETMRAFYAICQDSAYLGGVELTQASNFYADITGQDRIRLALVSSNPLRYRITLRYPRPWLDARDQKVKPAPMYRGLVINRVVTGKRFYAGSMTRSPLEHPGYHFQDEVLRNPNIPSAPFGTPFNDTYILAMDTLGPNRNGSRFFITTLRDPSLNGRFTAFGRVVQNAGRLVVNAIANTGTTVDQEPMTDMVISEIKIRRGTGVLSAAFFEGFQQARMPGAIEPLCLDIARVGSQFSLVTPWRPSSQTILYSSPNLITYTGGTIEGQPPTTLGPTLTDLTEVMMFTPKLFVKGFATNIPVWYSQDIDFKGARFGFNVTSDNGRGSLSLVFDETIVNGLVGTYEIDMEVEQTTAGQDPIVVSAKGGGAFSATYDFSQGPYRGVLTFSNVQGPLNIDQLTLHFDSNRFSNNPQFPESSIIRRFDARTTNADKPFLSYGGLYQKFE